jgi:hypothetical protein
MSDPHWVPDPHVQRLLDWAIDIVGRDDWAKRRVEHERFANDLDARMRGEVQGVFQDPIRPADRAGWYLYQAELYQREPRRFDMPLCARIIPVMTRLGEHLDALRAIPFAADRLRRGLVVSPEEIDSVFFELSVAQAYATRGWDDVAFIPEQPTGPTPDFVARRHGEELHVECKRKRAISEYARREREKWWRLSEAVRMAMIGRARSVVLEYIFHVPLLDLPDDYLERRVLPLLEIAIPGQLIDDHEVTVSMRPVNLKPVQKKLRTTMMRQDGTGLFRDLFGFDDPCKGITLSVYGRPNHRTPRYLEEVVMAMASIWSCDAPQSMRAKAQHFRRELAEAVRQLPRGLHCAAHIGAEAYDGEGIEVVRYERLTDEMIEGFDTEGRDLEVIYCHILKVEVPFDGNWAIEEDAHYWLRNLDSARFLLQPPGIVAPRM